MTEPVPATPAADDKRKTMLTRLALVIALAALIWGLWYVITQRGRVHTDNAYVGADTAIVTPQVPGAVRELRIHNTQMVAKGDVLLILDDADARVAVATAEAALQQARQRFQQAQATGASISARIDARSADITQAQAKLMAAQADHDRARAALSRREALAGSGAVSAEEVSLARADMAATRANLELARAAISAASANRASTGGELAVNSVVTRGMSVESNPDVAAARARLSAARLDLERTIIRAPVAGVVTQNQVQVGQQVAPGAPLMRIVPVGQVFVDANFKESQLSAVRIGQPVELTSDFYGSDVVFHGRVSGLAGGTGAAFSLIPAQNASGNWVKVVQRLPVRVTLDPAEVKAHPLRVGLSMDAVIDTRSQ